MKLHQRVDQLSDGACPAHHELAESTVDARPILLMGAAPGRFGRCDAIRARQREWDLAPAGHAEALAAREEGFSSDLVRDLRDTAVELGMMVDGRPLPEVTLDRALKKYGPV